MRPSRLDLLIETAFTWAKRSTCSRLHVGCVIHREGRILVQGYNGVASGLPHCDHTCTCHAGLGEPEFHFGDCPAEQPCTRAVHAEQNAIAWAARVGVALEGADLVSTHQPCAPCAMSIINAGVRQVLFVHPYRLKDGLEMMIEAGLEVTQYVDGDLNPMIGSSSDLD